MDADGWTRSTGSPPPHHDRKLRLEIESLSGQEQVLHELDQRADGVRAHTSSGRVADTDATTEMEGH